MKKIVFFLSIVVLVSSCTSSKLVNRSVPGSAIKEPAYFEPLAFVSVIDKGNSGKHNDSLSNVSKILLDSVIRQSKNLKVSKKVEIADLKLKEEIEGELEALIQNIIKTNKIEGVKIPVKIDSVLNTSNHRFTIATVASGFGRAKGNYGKQIAKGIGVGVLTLGMYTPVPIKANTILYVVIFDTQKREIIYYAKSSPLEKAPTDKKALEKQYRALFEGYIYF